jgi:sensor histidine kinase YesM
MRPRPDHGLTPTRVLLRRAFVCATFVIGIATLQGVTSSEGSPYAAARSALSGALQLYLWVVLYPVMIRAVRLLDDRFGPSRARYLGHIPLAIVVMGIHSIVLAVIQVAFGMTDYRGSTLVLGAGLFAWRLSLNLLCYGGLMVLLVFSDARASLSQQKQLYRELQSQLNQARLDALRLQLQPHFLFNTLNGIAMLVRERDTQNAVDMLSRLAGVLRTLLDDSRRSLITVAEEITFLRSYVELEQLRFHDRLRYTTEIEASAERALIPTLLLQPLVENGIRHGIAERGGSGQVVVRAASERGRLRLEVINTLFPAGALATERAGVGLSNTRARLAQIYGDAASFRLEQQADGSVKSTIDMPLTYQSIQPEAVHA